MQIEEFQFNSTSKVTNYAVEWKHPDAKAVVCLVHGLGEHCRRYDHMATYFANRGYAMIGFDHAGHGRTEGTRGHGTMDGLYNGIELLLQQASERYPSKPIFLYGHSMGGNLVLNYVLRKQPQGIKGVITTGAWIRLGEEPPKLLETIGRLLKAVLPSMGRPNELDANMISSVKEEVNKYVNDPLVHDRISFELGISLLDAGRWLDQYEGTIGIPALIMHGAADQITSPEGSRQLAERLKGQVTFKAWEELYHEIHNEREKEAVFDFTLDWVLMIND